MRITHTVRLVAPAILLLMIAAIAPAQTNHFGRSVNYTTIRSLDDDADEGSLEDQVRKLSEQVEELSDALSEQSDDFEDALDGKVDTGSNPSVVLNGRIHGDTWFFPDNDAGAAALETDGRDPSSPRDPENRLIWRRVRFGVKGKIKDNMEYKIEMEFADPNDTQYRDVYIGFTNLPILNMVKRVNQKRPYGLDHLNSSRYNVFMERPFIIEAFNQDARRLGICSYGVSPDLTWNWRYGVYNMELTQNDQGYRGDDLQLQVAGRLATTFWYDECSDGRGYGHLAISGTYACPDADPGNGTNDNEARFDTRPEGRTSNDWLDTGEIANADHYNLIGFEGVLNFGPMQVVGEYQHNWIDQQTGVDDLQMYGYYGYVSYFITGEHIPWDRKSGTLGRVKPFTNFWLVDTCNDGCEAGWGAWQIAARYSYADLNDQTVFGGIGEAITIGLNWHWNPNARMQFNYIHGQIRNARAIDLDQPVAQPIVPEANYTIIGTRFMVDF